MEGEGGYGFISENIEENVVSGDEQDHADRRSKYHRHSRHQIQELEAAFQENAHPNEKERLALGRKLNLEPKQVKFWFQNRRTQRKAQSDRHENAIFKEEHNRLRMENIAMNEAMRNSICKKCGAQGGIIIDQQHLGVENARLRDELNRLSLLLSTANPNGSGGLPLTGPARTQTLSPDGLVEVAVGAMEELMMLGQTNEPIWTVNIEGGGELLDFDAYMKTYPCFISLKSQGFVAEASRATGVVMAPGLGLVNALLDANQWKDIFPCMIGSSSTVNVISRDTPDSRNGVLQLMEAEMQLVSPLVPVRRVKFIRFCRQQAEGVWAIADVSTDLGNHHGGMSRRLPSGCIVYDLPNSCSKIVWIEHMEYDETAVYNEYRPLLRSGLGFGAQKWIYALQMHYENLTALMSPAAEINGRQGIPAGARRIISRLARSMVGNFCSGVCLTGGHKWDRVGGYAADVARVMVRKNSNFPGGGMLSVTSTLWLPVQHQCLFGLLLNEKLRSQWDILSDSYVMETMVRMPKGRDATNPNNICLLRGKAPAPSSSANQNQNQNQNQMVVLQDCSTDVTGSLIVYATVDAPSVSAALNGADPSKVPIVPSGFAIVPDCADPSAPVAGSLLTVGFQILITDLPTAKLTMDSVSTVVNLIARTIQGIRDVVHSNQQNR